MSIYVIFIVEVTKMRKPYAKKNIILYVLDLIKLSNFENPLSYVKMAEILSHYDIDCDKKTVKRNISYLKDYGYPIVNVKEGCYMDNTAPMPDPFRINKRIEDLNKQNI